MISPTQVPQSSANPVASRGASRMLVMGGIALILAGMIFGDIFAAFILHPNADRLGASLLQAATGVAQHDRAAIAGRFAHLRHAPANRRTKADAHPHILTSGHVPARLGLLPTH